MRHLTQNLCSSKRTLLLSFLVLFLFVEICFAEEAATEKVKVGISTALTGEAAAYGLDVKDAIVFANTLLTNDAFELIIEDDKCSGKDAVTVAKKLIAIDKVDFVLGFSCSGALLAAAPLYEKAKVPVIASCASSAKISAAGDYIFRTTPSDKLAASTLFEYLKKKHSQIALLSEETEYAQDMAEAFSAAAQTSTDVTLLKKNFFSNTSDFKTLLLSLRSKKPQALFVNTQSEGSFATIVQQLSAISWQIPVYGAYWPGSPKFLELVGEKANGIEFVDTPSLDFLLNDKGKSIVANFKKQGGTIRSIESVFASSFEALRLVHLATQQDEHALDFWNKNAFEGIFGSYTFDKNGDIIGLPFMLKRITKQKAEPIIP